MKYLKLGKDFNQQIMLAESIESLILDCVLLPDVNIPNIKHLEILTTNKKLLDYLPDSIESLCLTNVIFPRNTKKNLCDFSEFSDCLDNLPNQLKKLKLCDKFKCKHIKNIDNLPNSIEFIELNYNFNGRIRNIPNKLTKVKIKSNYKFQSDFANCEKIFL